MILKIFCSTLAIITILILLTSCKTLSVIPLSESPGRYEIKKIETAKDLVFEYQKAVIKISEWQKWYNIQVMTNYYNFNFLNGVKTNGG